MSTKTKEEIQSAINAPGPVTREQCRQILLSRRQHFLVNYPSTKFSWQRLDQVQCIKFGGADKYVGLGRDTFKGKFSVEVAKKQETAISAPINTLGIRGIFAADYYSHPRNEAIRTICGLTADGGWLSAMIFTEKVESGGDENLSDREPTEVSLRFFSADQPETLFNWVDPLNLIDAFRKATLWWYENALRATKELSVALSAYGEDATTLARRRRLSE